jgi:hypothetical protein
MVSVMVVAVEAAAKVLVAPDTAVPDVTVVIVCAAPKPLLPLNVKGPTSPIDVFDKVMVGSLVLVKEHEIALPAAVAAALRSMVPKDKFGVAVPEPIPEQLAAVSA